MPTDAFYEVDEKWVVGPPDGDSAIMQALGRYHAAFASLEFTLAMLLGSILGETKNYNLGHAILSNIRNIADRVQMIRSVIDKFELDESVGAAYKKLCDSALDCNARRNVYAHGLYEHNGSGSVRIKTYVFTANRKKSVEVLTLERVSQDTSMLVGLLGFTMILLGHLPLEEYEQAKREYLEQNQQ